MSLCMIGIEEFLRLYLVHPHFCILAFMVRHGQIVAAQLRHKNTGLCAEASLYFSEEGIVIGVLLLKDINVAISGKIDPLVFRVISGIVDHSNRRDRKSTRLNSSHRTISYAV